MRLRETNEVSIKLHGDLRPRPTGSFCSQRSWALGHILAECGQECFNCWKWFILFRWPPPQLRLVLFKWSQLAWFSFLSFFFFKKRETNHVFFWFVLLLIFIHLKVYKAGWHVWFKIKIIHPKCSLMEHVPPCKGLHILTAAASSDKKFLKYLRFLKTSPHFSHLLHILVLVLLDS